MGKKNLVGGLQRFGKALLVAIAVLPAMGLLLRLGADDILGWKWMFEAGNAAFANLPLLFAIGVAVGLADDNNGVAGLAGALGYYVIVGVAKSFNDGINMGVIAGIIAGVLAAKMYNKFKGIKLPDVLGFFGGKRFVPIATSFFALLIGVAAGFIWPWIQGGLNTVGNSIADAGAVGAGAFGVLNRLLLPFGLHHVLNTISWFEFGTFTNAAGELIKGDLWRFQALDPNAGIFMTGFFPIMMGGLPGAAVAMIAAANKKKRKIVGGLLLGAALTAFVTGITEPIEFLFLFLAPGLYLVHALLTGLSMAITTALGIKCGFMFSAGAIDYGINWNISTKPWLMIPLIVLFFFIYFFVFYFVIKKFDLPTPGRRDDEESEKLSNLKNTELADKAREILSAIGGKSNVVVVDACITRIRLTVKDSEKVQEGRLKEIGATGIMKLGENNLQIIVGTVADPLVTHMKEEMKK